MAKRTAPDWPALMKQDLARLYVDMTAVEFQRGMAAGLLPEPINIAGERWSRVEIDQFIGRLVGGEVPDWRASCNLYRRIAEREAAEALAPSNGLDERITAFAQRKPRRKKTD